MEGRYAEGYLPEKCPVCGRYTFTEAGNYDICPVCGWETDILMENEPDDWDGCANDLCLNKYRNRYLCLVREIPGYRYKDHGIPREYAEMFTEERKEDDDE